MSGIRRGDTGETLDRAALVSLLTAQPAAEATYTCPVPILADTRYDGTAADTPGAALLVRQGQVLTASQINGLLPPQIDSYNPTKVPVDGQTPWWGAADPAGGATGSGMSTVTRVLIDGQPVPFEIVDDTQVWYTVPAHPAGDVDLTLVGQQGASAAVTLTYVDFPRVTSITPTSGPAGQVITMHGTHLDKATNARTVVVGSGAGFVATDYAASNATTATFTSSSGYSAGTQVQVLAVDPNGNMLSTDHDPIFTYTA